MKRIATANRAVNLFGAGKDGFAAAVPGVSDATYLSMLFFNHVQEAVVRTIEAAGLALSDTDYAQFPNAIKMLIDAQSGNFCLDTGAANAYVVALDPPIAAWPAEGTTFRFRVGNANTGASTINAGPGVVDLRNNKDGALVPGDLTAGVIVTATYVPQLNRCLINNVVPSQFVTQAQADARYTGIGYMLVRDEKASGTNGGSSVVGIQTRTLNTTSSNTISGASLSGNQVTLPAGTYRVTGSAPAFSNSSKSFLYNVTDAANQLIGWSVNGISGSASDQAESRSFVRGRFTITGPKVFELRHYISEAIATIGLGAPTSQGTEVYAELEIIKES